VVGRDAFGVTIRWHGRRFVVATDGEVVRLGRQAEPVEPHLAGQLRAVAAPVLREQPLPRPGDCVRLYVQRQHYLGRWWRAGWYAGTVEAVRDHGGGNVRADVRTEWGLWTGADALALRGVA
jgi:hypothetical protein